MLVIFLFHPTHFGQLARDASTTLYALDKDVDPFDAVFMTDMREPQTRFDCIVRYDRRWD